ncbi:unnamed protein product [marine sediment metagenome]|uniref:Orn/DAP/Arg decarboxylase 2 N-terminal domain-containing protein n=1 Tax=marine sediment metagenome TaxID=412755 RepID=X1VJF9_9ZZZZ
MIHSNKNQLCINDIPLESLAEEYETPLYVYDMDLMHDNLNVIRDAIAYRPLSLHFACMANNNIALLKELSSLQVNIFVCTPGELIIAQTAGFKPNQIVVTGCNFSDSEITQMATSGITLIVNSLQQLLEFTHRKEVKKLGLRISPNIVLPSETINPAVGVKSRVGLPEHEVEKAVCTAEKLNVLINGVHMYIGTNILHHAYFTEAIRTALRVNALRQPAKKQVY